MLESELTHRLDIRNPDTLRNEAVFICGPGGGLDPLRDIPAEVVDMQDDLKDYCSGFQNACSSSGLTTGPRGLECSSLDLRIDGSDLDGRPFATRIRVGYDQPDEEGLLLHQNQDEYCIYPNGVGIARRIVWKVRVGGTTDRQVLSERFIEKSDLPGLGILKRKLLSNE